MKKALLTITSLMLGLTAFSGPQSAQAESPATTQAKAFTVVIDAGHGGADPGATHGSITEKDVNLKLAFSLKQALETHGLKVFMTRSEDKELLLDERAGLAKLADADCLLSLHLDAPDASMPIYDLYYYNQGKSFAGVLDTHLRRSLPIDPQQEPALKERGLYIIRSVPVPSVMVSGSWKELTQPQRQQQLIQGLTQGVLAYAHGD